MKLGRLSGDKESVKHEKGQIPIMVAGSVAEDWVGGKKGVQKKKKNDIEGTTKSNFPLEQRKKRGSKNRERGDGDGTGAMVRSSGSSVRVGGEKGQNNGSTRQKAE